MSSGPSTEQLRCTRSFTGSEASQAFSLSAALLAETLLTLLADHASTRQTLQLDHLSVCARWVAALGVVTAASICQRCPALCHSALSGFSSQQQLVCMGTEVVTVTYFDGVGCIHV